MKTSIEITNLTQKRIKTDFVKKIVRKTVRLAGTDLKSLEISVVFVSEAEIRKINRKYCRKNKSTDILSFNLDSGYNKKEIIKGPPASLCQPESLREALLTGEALRAGEIILCPDVIAKNACENKVKFDRELAFVLAHGVLHLLGWKHGRRMYELQDEISLM